MPKRYVVVGAANVHGHDPGETFLADLEPAHEARMLKGGFLALAADKAKPAEVVEHEIAEAPASEETPSEED